MEPGPVWRLPSAVWTNQGRPTLQGDHSRSSWSWSQGCDDRICGRGWGRLQNHCRKQGKAFAGENISGAHIFSSHAIQGPLDTDILREYIKTRSPLNYKWAFSFHSYPKFYENLVAGWRNGSRCGRSMENNFQALSPHSHLRSSTIYYVSKPSIMSWRNFSAENIYLFWKRKNEHFLKNTRNVKYD